MKIFKEGDKLVCSGHPKHSAVITFRKFVESDQYGRIRFEDTDGRVHHYIDWKISKKVVNV